MKKWLAVVVLLAIGPSTVLSQSYQRKALSTIRNASVNGSTFSFEVWVRNDSSGTTFFVGNTDFYCNYNASALNNPTLSNINSKYTGTAGVDNYDPMQTGVVAGKLQVGIRYTGAGGGSSQLSTAAPFGEMICQVNMNITNPSQTAQLTWDVVNSGVLTTGTFAVFQTFAGSENTPLPIQLAGFSAAVINELGHVRLLWRTLSETNNYGFYVQKSDNAQNGFQTISGLIQGHGTTTEPHDYSWVDGSGAAGRWYYRLRQLDLDGTEHLSEPILPSGITSVKEKPIPTEFVLSQNYPNPFNPATKIAFALPKSGRVTLEVFNLLGQKLFTLLDEIKPAGYHSAEFDGSGFSSGLYFYRMSVNGATTFMRKMILAK